MVCRQIMTLPLIAPQSLLWHKDGDTDRDTTVHHRSQADMTHRHVMTAVSALEHIAPMAWWHP